MNNLNKCPAEETTVNPIKIAKLRVKSAESGPAENDK
jgi:hypothetical protein